ncbi:MAG TPA: hypothetical protein VKA84_08215 [Gemmatimonadaceae bacterium]|nr:hypothetical protein [Gemmatimonadaceae bacterium]
MKNRLRSRPALRSTVVHFALVPLAAAAMTSACTDRAEKARADSLQAVTAEQLALTTKLSAQKDSLSAVIFEADDFITQIDSQIRTVKGLPKSKRGTKQLESPIEEQLVRRKETLARVAALVERTKVTAGQLAESRKREKVLKGEIDTLRAANATLRTQLDDEQRKVLELGATIERQSQEIVTLTARVDSIATETRTLGTQHYRAYYIVGTEKELLQKGVIEREGGANLLVARPGRSLTPARALDPSLFTAIDQREVREIQVPDSTRRYRVVSRQSLDNAEVVGRDKASFTGNLHIANTDRFWAPSRYLILVQK